MYDRLIVYGRYADLFRYERRPAGRIRKGKNDLLVKHSDIPFDGEDVQRQEKRKVVRYQSSASRATVSFIRTVAANLGRGYPPVFASITYAQNFQDVLQSSSHFNAFAKRW